MSGTGWAVAYFKMPQKACREPVGRLKMPEKGGGVFVGRSIFCVLVASLLLAQFARATPGGVDANGCHQSAKNGHHCHSERATGRGSSQAVGGHETTAQRDKRLKRECKGRANAGACLGFGG